MIAISLGAGVQSTTMALMAARGEIGPFMPDCAIFADTGDEPQMVYDHLNWLMSPGVLPFPVHIATRKTQVLSQSILAGDKMARPPLHVPGKGMMPRQCTRNYKVRPIRKKLREILNVGQPKPGAVELWIGISTDEFMRVKPSGLKYIEHRHPLIEKRVSRQQCLDWLEFNNYPRPPKSSCWHCPFQSNAQWRDKRDNQPEEWAKAVVFDRQMRTPEMIALNNAVGYLHPSKKPLDEADLLTEREKRDLYLHDCEGMCGV